VTLISRTAALCLIALSAQGCAPKTAADNPVVATTAVTPTLREQISINDGIRTREVFAIKDGFKEITLEENTRNGQLHGAQRKYSKGRLIEEVHYEDDKQTKVESQEWIDEMNELRSENCVLEKTQDYADPEATDPVVPQALLDQWNARCNERPFATDM
jgi:hypothetical protein